MRLLVFGLAVLATISACSARGCTRMEKSHPKLKNDEFPACNAAPSSCTIGCDASNGWVEVSGRKPYRVKCSGDKWDFAGRPKPQYHLKCVKQPSCDPLDNPTNGKVKCPKTTLESWCTYTCNEGYDLEQEDKRADYKVQCIRDDPPNENNAIWSKEPATCKLIVCDPKLEAPTNGQIDCNKGRKLGSVCRFWCDKNYDLRGTTKPKMGSRCVDKDTDPFDALGKWTRPVGKCDPIKCKKTLEAPENGWHSYPDDMSVDSLSAFGCRAGYEPVGSDRSTCTDDEDGDADGVWRPLSPLTCQIKECRKQIVHKSVIEKCVGKINGRYPVNTECTYTCKNEGTYMVLSGKQLIEAGTMTSKCKLDRTWTKKPPRCYPIKCQPPQKAPKNGYDPDCTNSNMYESSCTFKCFNKYALSHGRPVVCQDDGNGDMYGFWSTKAPTCDPNVCDDFRQISHGYIAYSNGNNIGSVGTVHCNPSYTPKKFEEIVCQQAPGKSKKKPFWDPMDLVCCVKCTINPLMRVAMVIDENAAQNAEDWKKISTFTFETMSHLFENGGFQIILAVITYDKTAVQVLETTEIKQWEDLEVMREEMFEMFEEGSGASNTGKALRDTMEDMFAGDYSEEPYIILMMGGRSADDIKAAAKEVRDADINILAVGFNTEASLGKRLLSQKELTTITGDGRNSFVIDNWSSLVRVTERMAEISKDAGCTKASENLSCPKHKYM